MDENNRSSILNKHNDAISNNSADKINNTPLTSRNTTSDIDIDASPLLISPLKSIENIPT